ncbi:MAG: DUF1848 domain-containing protein [Candidatus Aminicenantes bacterium]|nr:DUF1848 domain-containing protein [Candidatus Aminicenantes bacterium]
MNFEPKVIISASRRSDLVAHFPQWLAEVLSQEKVKMLFPHRRIKELNLSPEKVHTLVLWSKDFSHLLNNKYGLLELVRKYQQLYFHLTITGLGGTLIEKKVIRPDEALEQVNPLIKIAGLTERVSLRFDPIVYWWEGKKLRSNLDFFPKVARAASRCGLHHIRFSFTQWYRKAKLRATRLNLDYFDPPEEEKLEAASKLAKIALSLDLELYSCAQNFLTVVPGIKASSCINGTLLQKLHPTQASVSLAKDKSQRPDCNCTESIDIGRYSQSCPHSCVYCYANARL